MKGLTEILVSFAVGIVSLTAINQMTKSIKANDRTQNETKPTQMSGPAEDKALALNWGLTNINAPKAWRHQIGNKNLVVAIIDTGCDIYHPNLRPNLWINPGESGLDENGDSRATNGIDDDDNGFVDDLHGWNFAQRSSDVTDDHGHGTHIAGIIGAKPSNGLGISGVARDVSLMILKYYDTGNSGAENLENTIMAFRYAVRMGADIINYSGGGLLKSEQEESALRWAEEQGVLVVAAAGNEGVNSDFFRFYPADYDLSNILSVAAIDRQEQLLHASNHGLHTVDIAAPGKNIYSTLPNGQYGYMSGTSQATAFATGVAVLLMAQDARMEDPKTLIRHLASHGRPNPILKHKVASGSVLDAATAIDGLGINLAQMPERANLVQEMETLN